MGGSEPLAASRSHDLIRHPAGHRRRAPSAFEDCVPLSRLGPAPEVLRVAQVAGSGLRGQRRRVALDDVYRHRRLVSLTSRAGSTHRAARLHHQPVEVSNISGRHLFLAADQDQAFDVKRLDRSQQRPSVVLAEPPFSTIESKVRQAGQRTAVRAAPRLTCPLGGGCQGGTLALQTAKSVTPNTPKMEYLPRQVSRCRRACDGPRSRSAGPGS